MLNKKPMEEMENLKRLCHVGYAIKDKFELVCLLALLMKRKLNSKSKKVKRIGDDLGSSQSIVPSNFSDLSE